MGKHRRRDEDTASVAEQYERLVRLLYVHRPMSRSGLCVVCGMGWPCVAVGLGVGSEVEGRTNPT
jgi:hypothetical protein